MGTRAYEQGLSIRGMLHRWQPNILGLILHVLGIGLFCWLIFSVAVYAMRFFAALSLALVAVNNGARVTVTAFAAILAGPRHWRNRVCLHSIHASSCAARHCPCCPAAPRRLSCCPRQIASWGLFIALARLCLDRRYGDRRRCLDMTILADPCDPSRLCGTDLTRLSLHEAGGMTTISSGEIIYNQSVG